MTEEFDRSGSRQTGRKTGAVLEGATRVFLERGFAATSMDDVAAAAAVSKRTLYQYFPSKEALFVAIVRRRVDELMRSVDDGRKAPDEGADTLVRIAESLAQQALRPETVSLYRIVIAEAARMPELGRIIDGTALKAMLKNIERLLVRVAEQRGVRLENPSFAADVFISTLYGVSQIRALLGVDPSEELGRAGVLERRVACFERAFGLVPKPAIGAPRVPPVRPKVRPASA